MKKSRFAFILAILLAVSAFNAPGQYGDLNKIPHGINPNSKSPVWPGLALTTGTTRKVTAMNYYGGPLINTPTIYIIWYGNWNRGNNTDTPQGQQIVRDWASSIGGTPHYMLNTSLSVAGKPISGNVSFTPTANETTASGKTSLSDADIRTVVSDAVTSGRLPYNPDGVYFVITSSDVTASSGFCTQYCGWHTYGNISDGRKVRYSFVGNAARCINACAAQSASSPNGNPGVDGAVSVLTHELEEANTDPDINAWLDARGYENADKCAWTFGSTQFLVNGAWANMTFGGRNWLIQRNILKTGNSFFCMVDSAHN
jgi:hypothetical protein